jgi:Stage II sporulation protein E (SpoIIE)
MRQFDTVALRRQRFPRQGLIVLPLVLILAVPLIDLMVPPYIHLASTLYVAPALTATFASYRRTAWVGAAAVAALVTAGLERGTLTTENVIVQLICLVVLSALLVLFCHLREGYERDLVRVRRVSEEFQRVLLRPLPRRVGPLSIASEYHAAEADTHMGGDIYAVARMEDFTRLIIGDVRGKGLASISDAAILLEAFRAAAHRGASLTKMIECLEIGFQRGVAEFPAAQVDPAERFVTAVVVDIPDDEPVARLVSRGHPFPLLFRGGTATALEGTQPLPPIGMGALLDGPATVDTFPFDQGDLLLFYTDGVTEARNGDRRFYPLAERVTAWADSSPAALLQSIVADVRTYVGGTLSDDMAMIAVQREAPPSAPVRG